MSGNQEGSIWRRAYAMWDQFGEYRKDSHSL